MKVKFKEKFKEKFKGKLRIIVIFGALFLVIVALLLIIFNAGKKSYTVRFDLDGGTLLSGSIEQVVSHGQAAIPPKAEKENAYFHSWSTSYQRITRDVVIKAVWEYETTPGITYTKDFNQNYTQIESAYKYLQGEVYIGGYREEKKVLGICDDAFYECKGITKVYLLDGLLFIGDRAFGSCTSLSEIEIPETVIHLGNDVFKNCESLEILVLNEGLQEIGEDAFLGCKSLTTVVIPQSVESIGAGAFRGCEALEVVTIPAGIEEIGDETFFGCKSLKTIELPESIVRIGQGAFSGCESLETLVLPEGIQEIDAHAFDGCKNLKTIVLPKSLVSVAKDAFAGCDGLTIITNRFENEAPLGWEIGWNGSAKVEWMLEKGNHNKEWIA